MESTAPSSRPGSQRSARSSRSRHSHASSRTTEETPLLAREGRSEHDETDDVDSLAESVKGKGWSLRKRWPSILALLLLCCSVVFIMLGFLATEGIEEYAMQAADFKPRKLSLSALTKTGVRAHVEGDFRMDASKVRKSSVRNLGRFGTWVAREIESAPADAEVYLPEYGNALLGTARIPGVKVNIRNGHTTHISLDVDLEPGSLNDIRNVAHDWLDGRLGDIRVRGKAHVPLKSGLFRLGTQTLEQTMTFTGSDVPAVPAYNITKVNLREARGGDRGMGADVSVSVKNDFPVEIAVPPVAVDVLVGGCQPSDQLIMVGTAETAEVHVEPYVDMLVNVTGRVEKLPDELTTQCPNSAKSPLDSLLGNYMQGQDATVYINCCTFPDPSTPGWAKDLLQDITVPVPFAGREMGNLIKNFSLSDVHFYLPDTTADPGSPESNPQISAVILVDIGLPEEMNFPLDVKHIKADADVYYHKKKFGRLDLRKWQKANSTRIEAHGHDGPSLLVQADIKRAPLEITDGAVFSKIVQDAFLWGETVLLDIKAAVGVEVNTPIGQFAIRDIPAEGVVPVKPIGNGKGGDGDSIFQKLNLKMGNLSIVDTSPSSLTLQAHVNFTNPTNYSATVPYVDINVLVNRTIMGHATAEGIVVHPGNNANLVVTVLWDPLTNSGKRGKAIGSELLSQYVSGFNTSFTMQAHEGTIPHQPSLGRLLSQFPITVPAPRLSPPKRPGDDDPDHKDHFIQDATMHILSSTAIFTLASPFQSTTMYITHMNATAYYETHPAGKIIYDLPFAVPPGVSTSPRLPVDWSLDSLGYEAIKKALGGSLRLSAFAEVGVRIGSWREQMWYKGQGIGAKVRL